MAHPRKGRRGLQFGDDAAFSIGMPGLVFASPVTDPFAGLSAILAAGGDYSLFDFKSVDRLFQDVAGTVPAAVSQPVGLWRARTGAHFAERVNGDTERPILQVDGVKFDGTNDFLRTDTIPVAGPFCSFALATIPATLAATQCLIGSLFSSSAYNILGVSTAGALRVGAGDNINNYVSGDLRSTRACVGFAIDGAGNGRAFANGLDFTFTYGSALDFTYKLAIGAATNAAAGAGTLSAAAIERAGFGKVYLTPAQFQTMRGEMLAAA